MSETKTWGLLAEFETASAIYHACEKVRDAGYSKWDAHTPFPVHGLEKAMGLKPSFLPWIILGSAMTGTVGGFWLQGWVAKTAYPLVISAKPLLSWPAFVPVSFELTVLMGAFAAVFGMFAINRLPTLYHPLFNKPNFQRATDDRFFISIEASDPRYDATATRQLLEQLGAVSVESVED